MFQVVICSIAASSTHCSSTIYLNISLEANYGLFARLLPHNPSIPIPPTSCSPGFIQLGCQGPTLTRHWYGCLWPKGRSGPWNWGFSEMIPVRQTCFNELIASLFVPKFFGNGWGGKQCWWWDYKAYIDEEIYERKKHMVWFFYIYALRLGVELWIWRVWAIRIPQAMIDWCFKSCISFTIPHQILEPRSQCCRGAVSLEPSPFQRHRAMPQVHSSVLDIVHGHISF